MLATSDLDLPNSNGSASAKGASFNDVVLWNSFRKGNELALSMLYKKYVHHLYDYGMHTSNDHDLAMDMLQDLFMHLWNKRETLSNVEAVKAYLYTSYRRMLVHQLIEKRKISARMAEEASSFEFSLSIESTLIDDELRADRVRKLKAGMRSLTRGQREVIYLKFFNELSYHEIAGVMDMRIDSVYNLVSKAIHLLRKKLNVFRPLESTR